MKKVVLFGAGGAGRRLFHQLQGVFEIIAFLDNDKDKQGTLLLERPILAPEEFVGQGGREQIVVASSGFPVICEQLSALGVPESRIVLDYVGNTLSVRDRFLEDFATLFYKKGPLPGAIAEVGVFQGEFSKTLNRCFPDKTLYLFDTFEGFDSRDILREQAGGYSEVSAGGYAMTSPEFVLGRLPDPSRCVICKGYFPESAQTLTETFCFVNLDVDLYLPTRGGLDYLAPRMVPGGVILVHDYFSTDFSGVREAVDEFIAASVDLGLHCLPIGDALSVLLIGF